MPDSTHNPPVQQLAGASVPDCAPSGVALARQAGRLAQSARPPWLHQEVARRLAAKLAPINLKPSSWMDWSAYLGGGADLVRARYPDARRWIVEPVGALADRSRSELAHEAAPSWRSLWRRAAPRVWTPQDLSLGPWQPDGVHMLWANMTLHASIDLPTLMRVWWQQMAVDGFLMCSGLGPDTAKELRALYRAMDWGMPTIEFIDMHDLGDALVKAGFADPVMDMERLTLTWASPEAMLQELREWGGNVAAGRFAGCRTRRWREHLLSAMSERLRGPDGRLSLTVELVYGHAIKPAPRLMVAPETRVALDDMRRMIRRQERS